MVESYQQKVAGNPQVAMIHVSYDETPDAAEAWARKEKFPWLTVLDEKREASGLERFADGYVPEYILLSKAGEVLARGKEQCFAKLSGE